MFRNELDVEVYEGDGTREYQTPELVVVRLGDVTDAIGVTANDGNGLGGLVS